MCVNKEHYTCCCCSLTTATTVFGVFTGLATVVYALGGYWINFIVSALMSAMYIAICCKPHDAGWRKLLYYCSLIGWIASAAIFILVCILAMSSDYAEALCQWQTGVYYDTCMSNYRSGIVISMCVGTGL